MLVSRNVNNEVCAFLKKEVLVAETRIARVIAARNTLVRDLTQAVNHYV